MCAARRRWNHGFWHVAAIFPLASVQGLTHLAFVLADTGAHAAQLCDPHSEHQILVAPKAMDLSSWDSTFRDNHPVAERAKQAEAEDPPRHILLRKDHW